MGVCMGIKVLADRADDKPLLFVGELGIDGESDGLPGGRFRDRKVACLVAQGLKTGLQMQRDRIINLCTDLPRVR